MAAGIWFRPMDEADLDMLHHWLNEPGVVRWWEGEDVTEPAVRRTYDPNSDSGTEHWIAMSADSPIGWIQHWPIDAFPTETAPWIDKGVCAKAAGIDYLIAQPEDRGRGLGSAMIDAFVTGILFDPDRSYTQACASPFGINQASVRALEKAGFTRIAEIWYPKRLGQLDDGPCILMVRSGPSIKPLPSAKAAHVD